MSCRVQFRDGGDQLAGIIGLRIGKERVAVLLLDDTTLAHEHMSKERERLLEENRKLRLEKAALENLHRVETIARRDLGLVTPAPEKLVVVEKPKELPAGALRTLSYESGRMTLELAAIEEAALRRIVARLTQTGLIVDVTGTKLITVRAL